MSMISWGRMFSSNDRRQRFDFGRLTGFFGRWIGCQRPSAAAADDDFAAGKCGPVVVN